MEFTHQLQTSSDCGTSKIKDNSESEDRTLKQKEKSDTKYHLLEENARNPTAKENSKGKISSIFMELISCLGSLYRSKEK